MSRLMSVAFTEQAVVERRKTVTRRKGWWENKNGKRWPELIAEGFPDMDPTEFMRRFFIDAQGIGAMDPVTRIGWRYLDSEDHS